ncbi:hypothetical protein CHLRE_13g578700v5 [Chlamydomonas reinhardtii]|uniref:Uncharacterized protein n=1 Tax=Chlamydomonas reinhardtii TaxID=3055 RepID=A0A2K3D069_CHLRE|nr:uncharacterized protein CHLRE_13g578700v5 [Chlamydomonas reinhardtii]PNW73932.1 hypothetical protein CHLRE_13g578700v5 [Chlamydomonas reinhardtii]
MEVITAVKAVKAAAASRGVKGVELGQLMACLASIPAEEYRAFILPIADDPEAVFAYVQLRYKAQGVGFGSHNRASISTAPAVGARAPTAQQPYADMAMLKDALAEQMRPLMSKLQEVLADNAARHHHPNWADVRREWAMSTAAVPKQKKVL